jgi:hypothetical protein
MISVALDRNSRLLAQLIHTRRLGISLLSDRQHLIAEKFATKSGQSLAVHLQTTNPRTPSIERGVLKLLISSGRCVSMATLMPRRHR